MKFLFNLFAVLMVFLVFGTSLALAQDATETDEAPIVDVVAPVEDGAVAPVVVVEDNSGSPAWYLLALAVVVFFATFTQYNFERMTGKSMRELSNSVPSHAITLLLNGASYITRLTTTDADDKALLKVGEGMGYIPMKLSDGSILWTAPTSVPIPTPTPTQSPTGDEAVG